MTETDEIAAQERQEKDGKQIAQKKREEYEELSRECQHLLRLSQMLQKRVLGVNLRLKRLDAEIRGDMQENAGTADCADECPDTCGQGYGQKQGRQDGRESDPKYGRERCPQGGRNRQPPWARQNRQRQIRRIARKRSTDDDGSRDHRIVRLFTYGFILLGLAFLSEPAPAWICQTVRHWPCVLGAAGCFLLAWILAGGHPVEEIIGLFINLIFGADEEEDDDE